MFLNEKGMLTITALAKATGVPSKTLRYWEHLGRNLQFRPKQRLSEEAYRLAWQQLYRLPAGLSLRGDVRLD